MIDELESAVAVRPRLAASPRSMPPTAGLPVLDVRVLGDLVVRYGDLPVQPAGTMARALFALLALRPGLHAREVIATALWPDAGSASSGAFRQALWHLRRSLGPAADSILAGDGERIGLHPRLSVELDVTVFEAALRARPSRPEAAIALYRGDLMQECALECFARERERLSGLYEDALADVATRLLETGDTTRASDLATALLLRDPLREEAHATLIEVYGRQGSRSQVTRQYRRLRRILAEELELEPLPSTERSYRAALEASLRRSAADAAGGAAARSEDRW